MKRSGLKDLFTLLSHTDCIRSFVFVFFYLRLPNKLGRVTHHLIKTGRTYIEMVLAAGGAVCRS